MWFTFSNPATERIEIRNFIDGEFVEPVGFCHVDRSGDISRYSL